MQFPNSATIALTLALMALGCSQGGGGYEVPANGVDGNGVSLDDPASDAGVATDESLMVEGASE